LSVNLVYDISDCLRSVSIFFLQSLLDRPADICYSFRISKI